MLSEADERHGSTRGFHAGCRNICCRRAIARDEKARRLDQLRGGRAVPAIGAQRRLQALMALGWSSESIADRAGLKHRNHVWRIVNGQKGKPTSWIRRETDVWVRRIYDELSMTVPTGPYVARTKAHAAKKGWAPPLAWNNIDDPDEQPTGWQYVTADRAQLIRDMTERGDNLTHVARALGLSPIAVDRWCRNHGLADEYRTLAGREGDWNVPGNYAHPSRKGTAA